MGIAEIIILVIIAVWFIAAVVHLAKNGSGCCGGGHGCNGDCSSCRSCAKKGHCKK